MAIAVGMIETLGFPAVVEAAESPWLDTKRSEAVA